MGSSVVKPSVMARIQHRDFLTELPGACACCSKSVDEDGFADPQINIEWHGAVVFCSTCVLEMAQLFGYISPEQYAALKANNEYLTEQVSALSTSVDNLEKSYDALTVERLISRGVIADTPLPFPTEPEAPAAVTDDGGSYVEQLDATDRLLAEIAGSGEGESTESPEPSAVEGPDDVSESTVDNDLTGFGL